MLNLVNEQTADEKAYDKLSERMQDRYNLFCSLPDTIRDEWIEDIEAMSEKMDEHIDAKKPLTALIYATPQPWNPLKKTGAIALMFFHVEISLN